MKKLGVLIATLCCAQLAFASSRAAAVLDSLPQAKKIDQVAISPDGTRVAYIVDGALSISALDSGESHVISLESKLPLREPAWSHDSKQIAAIADLPGDVPAAQIWTVNADGSQLTKHADLKGFVQSPQFSPDRSTLAVLFIENMPRMAGPLQPMTPLSGEISKAVYEERLATIDLKTNEVKQVTPADMYIYEYDWTPDGKSWAAIAARGNGDAEWWVARLYSVSAATGAMREIYKPKWQIADPHVSPDGKQVAFIEGLMSDAGLTGGEINVVPTAGGSAKNLTPGIESSPSAIAWQNDTIIFAQNIDGNSGFGVIAPDSKFRMLWAGEELAGKATDAWVPSASFAHDAMTTAVIRQSASAPPEVWAGPIGKWKQLTHLNDGVKPAWGQMKNVHWMNPATGSGGTLVQGWLMFPKDYDPSKKYPLIINVHGGPSWACTSLWDQGMIEPMNAMSAMGWFTLCPNPRGSYGQGEKFTQANIKDFGGGDFTDIMSGIMSLEKKYPIDTKRIGIRGHSYGGYMTMWAETQTNLFAAAVPGAGLSDWLSYYGMNDIDEWMIPFFGASIYDDPVTYAKSDPMHFVKEVKTPTLILVGDSDGECPMEQSVEWWHALDALHVPTKMVVYPHEGHLFVKPEDQRDYVLRTMEWFDEWFAKAKAEVK
ncbi:MAG: S9 family peptidase [Terriglobales bacterium]|jgi:dipeptidyl aminopeptidase/acylaminoacyl peptidase